MWVNSGEGADTQRIEVSVPGEDVGVGLALAHRVRCTCRFTQMLLRCQKQALPFFLQSKHQANMGIQSNPSQVLKQCAVLGFQKQLLLNALCAWRTCQVECAQSTGRTER